MKKVATRNIPLKILSFFLAIVLWIVIMNIEDPYITLTIDDIAVTKLNTDVFKESNKIYDVESGDTISIKVRGMRSILEHLKNTDFLATADFKEMSLVYAVPIHIKAKESIKYNVEDIDILEQNDVMTLSLEDADTQTYRVDVKTTGDAQAGYYVTDMIANPNIIEISGSKKQVAKIREVIVEVSIGQADDSFEITTTPKALDENGYPVDDTKLEFQTKEIAVSATVLPTKEIQIIVSKEGNPHYGYTLTKMVHEPKVVTIAGLQEDLDKIGYITIPFNISFSKEVMEDTKFIQDYLDTTKYKIVGDSSSVAIKAMIEKLESKELSINTSSVMVKNLEVGYEAIIHTPGFITTKVMGPQQALDRVSAQTLEPSIDLAGYETGNYSVTIACNTDESLTVRPMTISVEIIKAPE
jgi:YbbR domain-containing protein